MIKRIEIKLELLTKNSADIINKFGEFLSIFVNIIDISRNSKKISNSFLNVPHKLKKHSIRPIGSFTQNLDFR